MREGGPVPVNVLIAEDEPNIVESLRFLLNQAGCDVEAVFDGDAAIQRLQAGPAPDVLILDLMIPKKNGFEIMKWIRAEPDLNKVPILMLTAKGQDQDRRTAEELGVDAFITKPFSNRDVADQVLRLSGG